VIDMMAAFIIAALVIVGGAFVAGMVMRESD
jgi:hypothetical protein